MFINHHVFLSLLCTVYIIPPAASFHLKSSSKSQGQAWHTSITLALERLRQEDYQFEMSLSIFWVSESLKYIKRPYLNPKETNYVFYLLISQCCHGLEFLGWSSLLDNFIVICFFYVILLPILAVVQPHRNSIQVAYYFIYSYSLPTQKFCFVLLFFKTGFHVAVLKLIV